MGRSSLCHALSASFILTLVAAPPQAAGQTLTWSGSLSTNWNFSDPNWNLNGVVGDAQQL